MSLGSFHMHQETVPFNINVAFSILRRLLAKYIEDTIAFSEDGGP